MSAAYFSADYASARAAFCAAANALPATPTQMYSIIHPHQRGPQGEELAIDVVQLGRADAAQLLIISSGVHGIEGFSGSAAQTGALCHRMFNQLGRNLSILLVHALNPYGFAHLRRGNENNVDLNRNFIDWNDELPEEHPLTHAAHRAFLSPEACVTSVGDFVEQYGTQATIAALVTGQYHHADGLCYGGARPSWSNLQWSHLIRHFAAHSQAVYQLDLHTGYGPTGEATLMSSAVAGTPAAATAQRIWGDEIGLESSNSGVLSLVRGPIEQSLPRLLPDKATMTTTLEIGVRPLGDNVQALLLEQSARNRGETEVLPQAQAAMRRCYAPDNEAWQQNALQAQLRVIERTVSALRCG